MKKQTNKEIGENLAKKIQAKLDEINKKNRSIPEKDQELKLFGHNATYSHGKIGIRYISYHNTNKITLEEAEFYLNWLNDGNVGRHQEALRSMQKKEEVVLKNIFLIDSKGDLYEVGVIKETPKSYTLKKEDYHKLYQDKIEKENDTRFLYGETKEEVINKFKNKLKKDEEKLKSDYESSLTEIREKLKKIEAL